MCNHSAVDAPDAQGGEYLFRYALTTHGSDWSANMAHRFGWGFMSPIRTYVVSGRQLGVWPKPSHSFLELTPTNIYPAAFNETEDGLGVILRLHGGAGLNAEAVVRFDLPGRGEREIWTCDTREKNLGSVE
jgi:alpha-mannosidase